MSTTLPDQALANRIGAEQVRSAYGNVAPGMVATGLAAAAVVAVLVGTRAISWTVALVFTAIMFAQIGARLVLLRAYTRARPPDADWRLWARRFEYGALAASLTLGVGSMWLLVPGHFDLQLLVMLYLCAVSSGAITAFGVLQPAIYFAIFPMMLPATVWMAVQGDWVHGLLAFIIAGWLAAIADQARRYGAQFRESVRLRFENEDLISRLVQEKAVAIAASAAKSRFLAAASHDLRQPVHALSLFVAALRPRVTEPEAARMLDHVDSSVAAMGGLFNGLLDISRLDAGVVEVNRQSFAIAPLLERICRDYHDEAAAKGVALRVHATPGFVTSDALLLERVIRNIVANAVAYTDRGGVLVATRRRGQKLKVQVWDTGRGIPPEEQTQVFQEFYQVNNPERDRSRGVGLGLAIVTRLMALLGHALEMRSRAGRGSVFSLELPRAESPRVIAPLGESETGTTQSTSGLILVVDDEAAIQAAMKSLLEGWGYQAVIAGSCDAMIEKLADSREHPALIICDYRLRAHEDGIRVIERLRSEYNDEEIPGMLITGDTAPDRLREAQESGLLLLHKPVANARLREAINDSMRRAGTSPPASGSPRSAS